MFVYVNDFKKQALFYRWTNYSNARNSLAMECNAFQFHFGAKSSTFVRIRIRVYVYGFRIVASCYWGLFSFSHIQLQCLFFLAVYAPWQLCFLILLLFPFLFAECVCVLFGCVFVKPPCRLWWSFRNTHHQISTWSMQRPTYIETDMLLHAK